MAMPQGDESKFMADFRAKYGAASAVSMYIEAFPNEANVVNKYKEQFGSESVFNIIMDSLKPAAKAPRIILPRVKEVKPSPFETIGKGALLAAESQIALGKSIGDKLRKPPTDPEVRPLSAGEPVLTQEELARRPKDADEAPSGLTGLLAGVGERALKQAEIQKETGKAIGKFVVEPVLKGVAAVERFRANAVRDVVIVQRNIGNVLPNIEDIAALVEDRPNVMQAEGVKDWMRLWFRRQTYKRIKFEPSKITSPKKWIINQRQRLFDLAIEGEIPTKADIWMQLGKDRAAKLITKMEFLNPNIFKSQNTWKWRGELGPVLSMKTMIKHPKMGPIIDASLQVGRDFLIEELTDPKEWILDFTVGKFIIVPAVKAIKARGLISLGITDLLRRLGTDSKAIRRALGKELVDIGASKEVINSLEKLSEAELRAMGDAVRRGKNVSFQLPKELLPKEYLKFPKGKKWIENLPDATDDIGSPLEIDLLKGLKEKPLKKPTPVEFVEPTANTENIEQVMLSTGYSREDVEFLRAMDLTDPEIKARAVNELTSPLARGAPVNVGDRVYLVQHGQDATLSEVLGEANYLVQLDNGMKLKVPKNQVVSAAEAANLPRPAKSVMKSEVDTRLKASGNVPSFDPKPPSKGDFAVVKDRPDVGIVEVTDVSQPNNIELTTPISKQIHAKPEDIEVVKPYEQWSGLDKLRAEQAQEMRRTEEAAAEAGFLRIRRRGTGVGPVKSPETILKDISKDVTGSEDYANSTLTWQNQQTTRNKVVNGLLTGYEKTRELVMARGNLRLLDAADPKRGKRYSETIRRQMRQLVDRIRTDLNTFGSRGSAQSHMDLHNIWGDLDEDELKHLVYTFASKSDAVRSKAGLPITSGISTDEAQRMFDDLYGKASARVKRTFDEYLKYSKAFTLEHIVKPGNMSIDNLFDFYMHHDIVDNLYFGDLSRYYTGKRLTGRTPYYFKQTVGTEKAKVVHPDVFYNYHAAVFAENARNDFAIRELVDMDRIVKADLVKQLSADDFAKLKGLKPNDTITVGDAQYKNIQYTPGRYIFEGKVANENLVAEGIEDAFIEESEAFLASISKLSVEGQYDELLKFTQDVGPRGGDALRRALVLGRYRPSYLVPVEVASKFANLSSKSEYIPMMREVMGLTSLWKRVVLFLAGFQYQAKNLFGDTANVMMADAGAGKHVLGSTKIIGSLQTLQKTPRIGLDQYDLAQMPAVTKQIAGKKLTYTLSNFEKKGLQITLDTDQFGAGFLSEFIAPHPTLTAKGLVQRYYRLSAQREALMRVALVLRQLERYQAWQVKNPGKPFDATEVFDNVPQMHKAIKYLTPEQAIGYIGRNVPVDYADIPDWYRRWFRGFLFPFITFQHKNFLNQAALAKAAATHPKLLAKTALKLGAPIAAIQAWNNTGWREEVYNHSGYDKSKLLTTVLWAWDADGNLVYGFGKNKSGKPLVKAKFWSADTPIDEAGEWIGLDYMIRMANLYKRGVISKGEAAKRVMKHSFGETQVQKFQEMTTVFYQIMEGIKHNKDPYDKQPIYDPTRQPDDYMRYLDIGEYVIGKMITSYAQYSRAERGKVKLPTALGMGELAKFPGGQAMRRLIGIVDNGPGNISRAMGFRDGDLRGNTIREMREEREIWEARERAYMRKLEGEYVHSDRSAIDFLNEAAGEVMNIEADPRYYPEDSRIGRIIFDARKKGLFVDVEMFKQNPLTPLEALPIDLPGFVQRIVSRVSSPWASLAKYRRMLNNGISPFTGAVMTKKEQRDLENTIAALQEIADEEDFMGSPKSVRAASLESVRNLTMTAEQRRELEALIAKTKKR